jgi:hypothetical protein
VTVEALVDKLDENPSILPLFDESTAFYGSLGLYKQGAGVSYERSVYLELHNGDSDYNRGLKSKSNYVEKPRFNLSLLGHPSEFIQMVRKEKTNLDDGMIQRFLLCAPKPVCLKSIEILSCPDPEFDLSLIFFVIKTMNSKAQILTFEDDEAKLVFHKYYDLYSTSILELTYKATCIT